MVCPHQRDHQPGDLDGWHRVVRYLTGELLAILYGLVTLLPVLGVDIRRLHDTNRSGWWILIGLIPLVGGITLIVFFALAGTQGSNNYGPEPATGMAA